MAHTYQLSVSLWETFWSKVNFALFPKIKAERRMAPSTVKISLLLCGLYLKREEVAGQVKVGLKFFYKVQKLAIISLGTVTDL